MAIHIKANLQSTVVNEETNPEFFNGHGDRGMNLNIMQRLVGGFVQIVWLNKPYVLNGVTYIAIGMNEEGKLSGMRFNAVATKIAKLFTSIAHDDVIVGDAILFERQELS